MTASDKPSEEFVKLSMDLGAAIIGLMACVEEDCEDGLDERSATTHRAVEQLRAVIERLIAAELRKAIDHHEALIWEFAEGLEEGSEGYYAIRDALDYAREEQGAHEAMKSASEIRLTVGTVKIECEQGTRREFALICDGVAINTSKYGFAVTHAKSGFAFCCDLTLERAIELMRIVLGLCNPRDPKRKILANKPLADAVNKFREERAR